MLCMRRRSCGCGEGGPGRARLRGAHRRGQLEGQAPRFCTRRAARAVPPPGGKEVPAARAGRWHAARRCGRAACPTQARARPGAAGGARATLQTGAAMVRAEHARWRIRRGALGGCPCVRRGVAPFALDVVAARELDGCRWRCAIAAFSRVRPCCRHCTNYFSLWCVSRRCVCRTLGHCMGGNGCCGDTAQPSRRAHITASRSDGRATCLARHPALQLCSVCCRHSSTCSTRPPLPRSRGLAGGIQDTTCLPRPPPWPEARIALAEPATESLGDRESRDGGPADYGALRGPVRAQGRVRRPGLAHPAHSRSGGRTRQARRTMGAFAAGAEVRPRREGAAFPWRARAHIHAALRHTRLVAMALPQGRAPRRQTRPAERATDLVDSTLRPAPCCPRQFLLDVVDEVPGAAAQLEPWRRDIHAPLVIEARGTRIEQGGGWLEGRILARGRAAARIECKRRLGPPSTHSQARASLPGELCPVRAPLPAHAALPPPARPAGVCAPRRRAGGAGPRTRRGPRGRPPARALDAALWPQRRAERRRARRRRASGRRQR